MLDPLARGARRLSHILFLESIEVEEQPLEVAVGLAPEQMFDCGCGVRPDRPRNSFTYSNGFSKHLL